MSGALFTLGEVLAVFLAVDTPTPATAAEYRRIVAGSESNVAATCARQGVEVTLVTRLGEDALGDSVAHQLHEWGIGEYVVRDERPTGVLIRGANGAGAVHLRHGSAATALSVEDVDAAWRSGIGAVFVTGITAVRSETARLAVERVVELAEVNGALVVVDPNYRPALGAPDEFAAALSGIRGHIDIAIGDAFELALLAGTTEAHAVSRLLADGCRVVVVKSGADGVVVHSGARSFHQSTAAVHVRDTVGAGDAFAAGFIAGLLDGASLEECAARGTVVAARVVETLGDIDGALQEYDFEARTEELTNAARGEA